MYVTQPVCLHDVPHMFALAPTTLERSDGVPIFFFFEAGGTLDVSFRAGLCLADMLVRAAIVPTAAIYVEVGGGKAPATATACAVDGYLTCRVVVHRHHAWHR